MIKSIKSTTSDLVRSISSIFSGLIYILTNTWTWKYIALIVLVNIVIYTSTFFLVWNQISSLILTIPQYFNWSTTDFYFFFWQSLAFISTILVSLLIFQTLSSVFNSPIYGRLTSKIWEKTNPSIKLIERPILTEVWLAIKFEINKLVLVLVFLVLSFLLNFIPFVGQLGFLVLNFFQLILIAGLDLLETSQTLKGLSFRQRIKEIISKPALYWPYLTLGGILVSLPVVNIFTIPIAIVGGARLLDKVEKQ